MKLMCVNHRGSPFPRVLVCWDNHSSRKISPNGWRDSG
jgi:hypothetical protein